MSRRNYNYTGQENTPPQATSDTPPGSIQSRQETTLLLDSNGEISNGPDDPEHRATMKKF